MGASVRPTPAPVEAPDQHRKGSEYPAARASDARLLNWRFLVPDEPEGLLFLPMGEESIEGAIVPRPTRESFEAALSKRPFPAASAPDLGAWAGLAGGPVPLVRRLMESVQPGGWLHLGFANLFYPARPLVRGSVRPGRVERLLRKYGFDEFERYLAFPSQHAAAYLVSARSSAQLDYFLHRLAFPYSDAGPGRFGGSRVSMRSLMLRGAVAAPNCLRVRLAPAFAYVAVRSAV